MATITKTDLNQVVRRKSCFCSGCGGHGEAIERLLMREALKEPIPPFVKSKEEIAYEKRLLKRTKAIEEL